MSANGAKNQLSPLATKRIPKETTMNTEINPIDELIEQTRALLNAVRGSSVRIGQNLYELKADLPKDQNWGEFLRDQFDIGESFASKLMKIHKVFVLDGGLSTEDIEGIDGEKLYLSAGLEGSALERVSKARTLTRRELKDCRVDDGHVHSGETVEIHKCCGMRV